GPGGPWAEGATRGKGTRSSSLSSKRIRGGGRQHISGVFSPRPGVQSTGRVGRDEGLIDSCLFGLLQHPLRVVVGCPAVAGPVPLAEFIPLPAWQWVSITPLGR